jgi:Flp pilus assembly protein TadG
MGFLGLNRAERLPGWRKNFARDNSGATMLEFALVAPFAVIMIMAVIELSLIMLAQNVMESATFTASREGKTGFVNNGETREQTILNVLNARAGSLLNTSEITITTTTYNNFNNIGQPEPYVDANGNSIRDDGENYTDINGNGEYDDDQGAEGAGAAGEVVVYLVSYPWHIFTPVISQLLGLQNSTITLSARAIIKNEPFNGG